MRHIDIVITFSTIGDDKHAKNVGKVTSQESTQGRKQITLLMNKFCIPEMRTIHNQRLLSIRQWILSITTKLGDVFRRVKRHEKCSPNIFVYSNF